MARTKTFNSNKAIVQALQTIGTENEISRFHKVQLIEIGVLEAIPVPEMKKVPGSKGRNPYVYNLTKKGKNLLQLSKSWFKTEAVAA